MVETPPGPPTGGVSTCPPAQGPVTFPVGSAGEEALVSVLGLRVGADGWMRLDRLACAVGGHRWIDQRFPDATARRFACVRCGAVSARTVEWDSEAPGIETLPGALALCAARDSNPRSANRTS